MQIKLELLLAFPRTAIHGATKDAFMDALLDALGTVALYNGP